MNENPEPTMVSEDDLNSILSSQQSRYEHIQSMAATFLSIILSLIIAVGGLISAGILQPQIPTRSNGIGRLSIEIDDPINMTLLSLSKESSKILVEGVLSSSILYTMTGIIISAIGALTLTFCLAAESIEPAEAARTTSQIRITSHTPESIQTKKDWIENNSDILDSIEKSFNKSKNHLIVGAIFCLGGIIGILGGVGDNLVLLILFILSVPFAFLTIIISKIIRICRTAIWFNQIELVKEDSVLYGPNKSGFYLADHYSAYILSRTRYYLNTSDKFRGVIYIPAILFLILGLYIDILTIKLILI